MDSVKASLVCELVSDGESLRKACEAVGVTKSSFLRWCAEDKQLADQYARARDTGTDIEFEALQELAEEVPEKGPHGSVDAGWVAWKRLQVDTKKWALSKKAPKKYGDKIELDHKGSLNVTLQSGDRDL